MLDKEMKDYEASVELLKDRKKQNKILCFMTLLFGGLYIIIGLVISYNSIVDGLIITMGGIAIITVSGYFHRDLIKYQQYIFMIKKGIVQAPEKKE